jgi:hypothetical protein
VIRIRFTDHDSLFTLRSSAARDSSSNLAVAMSRFDFMDRHVQSPTQVRQTRSTSHPHEQRNAFRRRDARQQSRSFARLESMAETQPKLHPALLRLSAMTSQNFTLIELYLFYSPHSNDEMI